MDIFDILTFFTNLFTSAMGAVGAGLALLGLCGLGMGVWDVLQHFKPENRDNPDQKSRLTSGVVKFICGGLLATGGYQVIANNTFKNGVVTSSIDTSEQSETSGFFAMNQSAQLNHIAAEHGLVLQAS